MSRSAYYYKPKPLSEEAVALEMRVRAIFSASRQVYGARKIKSELESENIIASRRRIRSIMKKLNLTSVYTQAQYKYYPSNKNEDETNNIIDRKFNHRSPLEVVVSDLTYVRVNNRWAYVCAITDLFNREIIGYACDYFRDAALVHKAFDTISYSLDDIDYFHTDRGSEFNNQSIQDLLEAHNIKRSLSRAGNPYDNAVAENIFKSLKTELLRRETFHDLGELNEQLTAYVQWWNRNRRHTSLDNMTPLEYRTKYAPEEKDSTKPTP